MHQVPPDSKVHGASMGPIWGRQDPGGPHVGPMNFALWGASLISVFWTLHGFGWLKLEMESCTIQSNIQTWACCSNKMVSQWFFLAWDLSWSLWQLWKHRGLHGPPPPPKEQLTLVYYECSRILHIFTYYTNCKIDLFSVWLGWTFCMIFHSWGVYVTLLILTANDFRKELTCLTNYLTPNHPYKSTTTHPAPQLGPFLPTWFNFNPSQDM